MINFYFIKNFNFNLFFHFIAKVKSIYSLGYNRLLFWQFEFYFTFIQIKNNFALNYCHKAFKFIFPFTSVLLKHFYVSHIFSCLNTHTRRIRQYKPTFSSPLFCSNIKYFRFELIHRRYDIIILIYMIK